MAETAKRRPVRRRPRWRRSALPRSRTALALGAVMSVVLLVLLLLLGLTRARPGRDVPAYDPAHASTTVVPSPVPPPSITRSPTAPTVLPTPSTVHAAVRAGTTTTRHR